MTAAAAAFQGRTEMKFENMIKQANPLETTPMTANEIIAIAADHLRIAIESNRDFFRSSAELCLEDARYYAAHDKPASARERALKSLAYSIGIAHPDYQRAAADSR
jgi:hypothetical protein